MAFIYKIINDINNKVYVGQTAYSLEKRFKEHCKDAFEDRNEKRPLYAAMRKYGVEHFHIELLEETDNPEEREKFWIEEFNSFKYGYNATLGGEGKCLYVHKKIVERLIEYPYPILIAREFGCCLDIVLDLAKLNNIKVRNASWDGIVNSSVREKKRVIAYTKDGNKVAEFVSVSEAAKWCVENGFAATLSSGVRSHIAEAANSKRRTAYKHIWKYVSSGLA